MCMDLAEDVVEALALADGSEATVLVGGAEMGRPPAMQALQRRWLRARHCFFEYACEGSASWHAPQPLVRRSAINSTLESRLTNEP